MDMEADDVFRLKLRLMLNLKWLCGWLLLILVSRSAVLVSIVNIFRFVSQQKELTEKQTSNIIKLF